MTAKLTDENIAAAAKTLGVDVASVKAVLDVESNGSGFLSDGRPVIQYEPHVMYSLIKTRVGVGAAETALARRPDLIAKVPGSYQKLSKEQSDMGEAAKQFGRDMALEAASWGLFQIMGYHWKRLGYPTLQEFVNAMYRGEAEHLDAFVRFVKTEAPLLKALKARDWAGFARRYNGPGYAKNRYDIKLADAYKRFSAA